MQWVTLSFLFLALLVNVGGAGAQTGCVPNPSDNGPPFINRCPLTAAGLNKIEQTIPLVGYTSTASCDGATDVTADIQNDLYVDSGKGGGLYYMPKSKGCVISSANLAVPHNMQIVCAASGGGYWPSGNFTAYADFLVSSSYNITFGAQKGGRSGISGCLILRQGYTTVSTLRQAIQAAQAYAGAALVCASQGTDVIIDENLIIGFATGLSSACDRLQFVNNRGDDTTFLSITFCNDTCTVHDDEAWPFAANPYGSAMSQTTNVTGATIGGGGTTLTLTFAAPGTPLVAGDTVVLANVGGITGAASGRFSVSSATPTQIVVAGTFSGAYMSGGTIYLSGMRRTGTGFNISTGAGGGPVMARLTDYGHDVAMHYAGSAVVHCVECWLDNDTVAANLDPVPVALLLDGTSGLTNAYQGFLNTNGIAIYKNDQSTLTIGPATQISAFGSQVGNNAAMVVLKGALVLEGAEVFTDYGYGAGAGVALYMADTANSVQIVGGAINGSVTFQNDVTDCPKLVQYGGRGPCGYIPTYTGASIAGSPLQAEWWTDASGKTTVFYEDNGHAVSGQTSAQFSISMPTTAIIGGTCTIGNLLAALPTGSTQFMAYIPTASGAALFTSVGNNAAAVLPGTALGGFDQISMICVYQ
jgi:hypothetical protein